VVSVHAPHPLELQEGQQQQLLLPELPPASRNSQPTTLQIVLQTPSSYAAHISLPASNAAEVSAGVVRCRQQGGLTGPCRAEAVC
jgi:hypothetical protein